MSTFNSWLKEECLPKYGLDDEAFFNFIWGILTDDSYSLEEKKTECMEYIESLTDEDISELENEIFDRYAVFVSKTTEESKENEETARQLEKMKLKEELKVEESKVKINTREASLTEEERLARMLMLSQYDEQEEDIEDEKGNLKLAGPASSSQDAEVHVTNRDLASQAVKNQRDRAAQEYKMKVEKDKADLQAQKISQEKRKDQARKKAARRERRRG
eukprot:GCRY01001639.1.p1 GENE.GCRY01001639.1~~GCRY01001639.1.p1  ORF type:complete len:233 (-),score=33.55 GCRY01001639.1:259-912(-)